MTIPWKTPSFLCTCWFTKIKTSLFISELHIYIVHGFRMELVLNNLWSNHGLFYSESTWFLPVYYYFSQFVLTYIRISFSKSNTILSTELGILAKWADPLVSVEVQICGMQFARHEGLVSIPRSKDTRNNRSVFTNLGCPFEKQTWILG